MTDEQKDPPEPKKKKGLIRRILKYFCLFILALIVAVAAGSYWICQTKSGRNWLAEKVNAALAPGDNKPGYKITYLSGSLPFDFKAGLEAYDLRGLWLRADEFQFSLDWTKLPSLLQIDRVAIKNVDVVRLPDLPPSPEPEPEEKPFEPGDINNILKSAFDFLKGKPWWLPDAEIKEIAAENLLLPAELAPQKNEKRTSLNARMDAAFRDGVLNAALSIDFANADKTPIDFSEFLFANLSAKLNAEAGLKDDALAAKIDFSATLDKPVVAVEGIPRNYLGDALTLSLPLSAEAKDLDSSPKLSANISGPNLDAGNIALKSSLDWQTGPEWKDGRVDGPISLVLNIDLEPARDLPPNSFLAILPEPIRMAVSAKGDLPHVSLNLDLACREIIKDKYAIRDLDLSLSSPDIALPLAGNIDEILDRENKAALKVSGQYDKKPIDISSLIFFRRTSPKDGGKEAGWDFGLRDLAIDALGVVGEGDIRAALDSGRDPALDGQLGISIDDWSAISLFVPDFNLSGQLKLDVGLNAADAPSGSAQNATVNLAIPSLEIRPSSGKPIALKNVKSDVKVFDLFGKLAIDADLDAADIAAEGMKLNVGLKAKGPIDGPLSLNLKTGGAVKTLLVAGWQPGLVTIDALSLEARLPGMEKIPLGLRSREPARLTYGKEGIAVKNLDVSLSPTGQLRANGGLSPDKLDFSLALTGFNFKPWQALVSAIPAGSADISANLKGTPSRPSGDFLVELRDVVVPKVPLAPVSMRAKGDIVNAASASALKVNLEINPATLKALGAAAANISASVPLRFGEDGVPNVEMNGPLSARVRWDGALGPLWNLAPIPDRRLNGRIAINADVGGSIKTPAVKGFVNVEKARYEDLALGILLTDINLRLDLTEKGPAKTPEGIPGGFKLAMSASDGHRGTININGRGGLMGEDLDIVAKIDRLKPLRRRDIHIELSGDAKVVGDATAPVVDGEIVVNQGEVLLDNLAFGGSVTTLPISTPESIKKAKAKAAEEAKAAENSAPPAGSGSLNVKINMLPRFTVEGRGLTSLWKANLLVGGTPTDPRVTGDISSVKGNFDFLGKNFALTKGVVFFGGGAISNPLLDIELTNETPDLTARILVTGPVSKIKLTLTSEPEMPRDEILAQVLFGKNMSDLSRLEALQLAGAVAQLAGFGSGAGGILDMAKKTLGVDVLRLGTASDAAGQPGEETASGTTIEMGKYINDMIYMGVQQGMKADSTAFIIQLELTPRTSFEVRTEQSNTWGGIKWKYNY